jgi:hypothetical protein
MEGVCFQKKIKNLGFMICNNFYLFINIDLYIWDVNPYPSGLVYKSLDIATFVCTVHFTFW